MPTVLFVGNIGVSNLTIKGFCLEGEKYDIDCFR